MDNNFSLFLAHRQVNPSDFSTLPSDRQTQLEHDWLRCQSFLRDVQRFNPDVLAEAKNGLSQLRAYDRFLQERSTPQKSEFEIRREVQRDREAIAAGEQLPNEWDEVARVRRAKYGGNEPA